MLYAIIDIGSNTIRLAVYDCAPDGSFRAVQGKKLAAGLAGYAEDGALSEEGVRTACDGLSQLLACAAESGVARENIYAFATASLRGVKNGEQAAKTLRRETGAAVELLSGEEEARFDFLGALHGAHPKSGLVVDIGGGSCELVPFSDEKMEGAACIPLGSLKLKTRFVAGRIPTREEFDAIRRTVTEALRAPALAFGTREEVCGVGGTLRAMARLCRSEDDERDDAFTVAAFRQCVEQLLAEPKAAEKRIARVAPDRVHTLLPGAALFDAVAKRYGCARVRISRGGVREGYLIGRALAAREGQNGKTGLPL